MAARRVHFSRSFTAHFCFRGVCSVLSVVCLGVSTLLCSAGVQSRDLPRSSQTREDEEANWVEEKIDTAPSWDVEQGFLRAKRFDPGRGTALRWGLVPDSLSTGSDQVQRYIVVTIGEDGSRAAFYEGLRCATGEAKRYGYFNMQSQQWQLSTKAQWESVFQHGPMRHTYSLARLALCEGKTTQTPAAALEALGNIPIL